jgi:hypothetical protein
MRVAFLSRSLLSLSLLSLLSVGLLATSACSSTVTPSGTDDGGVDAAPIDAGPFDCAATESSDIPGVAIRFTTETCTFSLAQAAAGISIPYEVKIDREMKGVFLSPDPEDVSRRDTPDASGLALFEILSGSDQRYCLCDTGLPSKPDPIERMLKVGTFPEAFRWDGVNWRGPSDTSNPKGKPFPAGVYRLEVRASGTAPAPGGTAPFKVKASINVRLVP